MDPKLKMKDATIQDFIRRHYKHFNAAVVADAAEGWVNHLERGGKMLLAMGGAMSTAELGISLAEMIRRDKIHAISTTGANLEEDIFNLVAHDHYERLPHYRHLSEDDEFSLRERGLNRVTDTCIPETTAMRKIEGHLLRVWQKAEREKKRYFPYEYIYQLLESGVLVEEFQADHRDSWVLAAFEKQLPIYTPGWEDSTMANGFVGAVYKHDLQSFDIVKSGLEQMRHLVDWYQNASSEHSVGFFQIGGGIAGDFPICVVPLIRQDIKNEGCPLWGYFAQIGDSTTSYGSYSGAVPNEKITWGKLSKETPRFMIESDATIVAPLIFHYILEG